MTSSVLSLVPTVGSQMRKLQQQKARLINILHTDSLNESFDDNAFVPGLRVRRLVFIDSKVESHECQRSMYLAPLCCEHHGSTAFFQLERMYTRIISDQALSILLKIIAGSPHYYSATS